MPYKFNPITGNFDYYQAGTSTNSFAIIQTPNGTSPTASSSTDTLDLTSSDSSITITGNSTTKTVNFGIGSTYTMVPSAKQIWGTNTYEQSSGNGTGDYLFTQSPQHQFYYQGGNKIMVLGPGTASFDNVTFTDTYAGPHWELQQLTRFTTTDASTHTPWSVAPDVITNGQSNIVVVWVTIVAMESGGANYGAWYQSFAFKKVGGVCTILGTVQDVIPAQATAGMSLSIVGGGTGSLSFQVQGATTTTTYWRGMAHCVVSSL